MTTLIPPLVTKVYRTISRISGPLLFIDRIQDVAYNEIVAIQDPEGQTRLAQVLEVDQELGVVQVFAGTSGLDLERTSARFTGEVARLAVAPEMLGRVFDGFGRPLDGGAPIVATARPEINGLPINPAQRRQPTAFIQTGVSAIDGLNSLARGQKLPIFSGAGLPANELVAQIAAEARIRQPEGNGVAADDDFAIVFAAIGITRREADFFRRQFEAGGAMDHTVLFLNQANDPAIERLFTPRAALTAAEYLAFALGRHVLVILTDMTNYCEALREVAAAREEVPGRRGYPGYMYSDLASLYERAGRLQDQPGSVTQLIILTMPDDDITHPIPDLTGYITEGQIVLSRELHRKGVYPPIDVLPSLSRLMNAAIGAGQTRGDHRPVADQLYALYAEGRDLRRLVAIIGEGALSAEDQRTLQFTERFEAEFIGQGRTGRSIEASLDLAWELLAAVPRSRLKRIPPALWAEYGLKSEG
ncbi:MAG: V-type ATP synthase subunit B [Ardenticatenales bacterium]|nr:V-type ATP synthase subunit B [Ardenticatenales bacterium]